MDGGNVMTNVGFRIYKDFERVDKEVIAKWKDIPTTDLSDVMERTNTMNYTIKGVHQRGVHIVGSALTVRTPPGDHLMVQKAMDLAKPGDIIVIDACGGVDSAVIGELMCRYAKTKGIVGFIIDGLVRDTHAIYLMNYPVFAKGGIPQRPSKKGPGEINSTISCGGVHVSPGDVIVADDDGVIVIPKADVTDTVIQKVNQKAENEKQVIHAIDNNEWDRDWIDKLLQQKGCEIIEKLPPKV